MIDEPHPNAKLVKVAGDMHRPWKDLPQPPTIERLSTHAAPAPASPPSSQPRIEEAVAGMITEIYRHAYPHMTEKSRGMLKDYMLREPASYDERGPGSRAAAARKLATRLVEKHYKNIASPGPLLPRESWIEDKWAKDIEKDIKKVVSALRPSGGLIIPEENARQEAALLAKQLQLLPPISAMLKNQNTLIHRFANWVNAASRVGANTELGGRA